MIRVVVEALVTLALILTARAVITGLFRAFSRSFSATHPTDGGSGARASYGPPSASGKAQSQGVLHRDPVCGTFVPESTPFRRQTAGHTFYYCSDLCRETHLPVAK